MAAREISQRYYTTTWDGRLKLSVGIDVHKKMCPVAVLDEDETLLDETRFMNTKEDIDEFASSSPHMGDEVRAVVESTGNFWIQVNDRFEKHISTSPSPAPTTAASSRSRG